MLRSDGNDWIEPDSHRSGPSLKTRWEGGDPERNRENLVNNPNGVHPAKLEHPLFPSANATA